MFYLLFEELSFGYAIVLLIMNLTPNILSISTLEVEPNHASEGICSTQISKIDFLCKIP